MNIESKPIEVGTMLFLKYKTPAGNEKRTAATVLEIMERPAASKVRYPNLQKLDQFKRKWHPATDFTFEADKQKVEEVKG